MFSVKTPSPKLCAVAVDGASGVSERELVEALTATVGADYSRFYVTTASNGTLTDLYRQRGYWRAAFDAPTATVTNSPTCAGAAVTLHVTEGRKYAWERATWTGNTALSAANLDSMLDMKNGETADGSKISSALYRVATAYANRGYIKAATRYTPRLDDAAARATFEFTVEEGPQFHAGALELVGLSDADAATLKKKWQLKAGDVYDESYVMKFRNEHTLHVQRGSNQAPRPADIETRVDDQAHVVDVRFVFR